jgi:hypothetical protein
VPAPPTVEILTVEPAGGLTVMAAPEPLSVAGWNDVLLFDPTVTFISL